MKTTTTSMLGVLMLALAIPATVSAQTPPPATEVGAASLAMVTVPAKNTAKLTVTSPAFANGGDIPFENTQYRANVFPGLAWTAGPATTKSYVIIMQDGDGVRAGAPFLHWTLFNIPATITKLDAAMTAPPAGANAGPNYRGAAQWFLGPRTPAGPKHRYHIQVFAMDATIAADSTTSSYTALIGAMKGHVLSSGELVGLGQIAPAQQQ